MSAAIVEFFGVPGVGKSYLSRVLSRKLEHDNVKFYNATYEISRRNGPARVILKTFFVSVAILNGRWQTFFPIVFQTRQNVIRKSKLLFNLLYVCGVISRFQGKDVIIFDQGLYQGLWSVHVEDVNKKNNFLRGSPRIENYFLCFVQADEGVIKERLKGRGRPQGRFDKPGMSLGSESQKMFMDIFQIADVRQKEVVLNDQDHIESVVDGVCTSLLKAKSKVGQSDV